MGYCAGMEVTLNTNSGYVLYNGRNLVFVESEVESWDLVGDVDSMRNIKPELLTIIFNPVILSQEDRDWLKKDGVKKGDTIYFTWDRKPHDYLWSGYCRSPLKISFPIELKGVIETNMSGSFDVTVTIKMASLQEFKIFIDDILDYYPDDESCQEYIDNREEDEEEMTIDEARSRLNEINDDDCRANYGA